MFTVYAIYNKRHNKFYIGQTENINERITLHNNKIFINSYTAKFDGTWEIIYSEEVDNRIEALMREKQLKSYRGRQFIKQHIPQ
ncbi:MAG: hypothetical protein A3A97_04305 [Candidatus Terrybacteria bacterium RIFCSPLOWO2_01_FULL_40_23]|uniref:GIY-YIG domain-containing protein n=1 Tax=Candidatus Terrybacteria bacterium RIFCSPLOWO2_01_FULL_40_23 TaxID=1802366 RepID=A0A1G2PZ71_9BACT|nr:MAG: hypothetical protein A3A97_04305 [Candidatus Terrybacteria bacterium RIFCSPLOWO2_01_FULL_40_23]